MPRPTASARFLLAPVAALSLALPAAGQDTRPAPADSAEAAPLPVAPLPYAFHADLVLAAPVIADAAIRATSRIKGPEAANAPPGAQRFYVTADVLSLIRGAGGVPPRVGYLVDVPLDNRGRAPKLKNLRVLLFARPVPGAADQLQLVSPDAQLPWTPAADALVRRIAREAVAADAPPVVTGVGTAFHVAGSLPGEGETQIFLQTADARPVSLSVLRRPGERPRWGVALGEIVDDSAVPPARDTLAWYRLACFLPRALPAASTAALAPADADTAREDYRFVVAELGACGPRAALGRRPPARAEPIMGAPAVRAPVSGGDAPA